MINLESRKQHFDVVISDLSLCDYTFSDFDHWLANSGFRYYGIVHDKDIDENGQAIRAHAHIVLTGKQRWRVKQLLTQMADALYCDIRNIQITEIANFIASVQYLIHKNDPRKYQYDWHNIMTNDKQIEAIINENIKTLSVTTEGLMKMIFEDGVSRLDLIRIIGIGTYQHYRTTINDLFNLMLTNKLDKEVQ